jgi:hypothetical protein
MTSATNVSFTLDIGPTNNGTYSAGQQVRISTALCEECEQAAIKLLVSFLQFAGPPTPR